jgi:transketolase
VYTLIGDGESQEGQIWEAGMLAAQYKLDNLIVFTDDNKMQIDDITDNIVSLRPLDKKWESFGWYVQSVDGHDFAAIDAAVEKAKSHKGQPSMILLNTVKGKGLSFAEGMLACHNMPITAIELAKACEELK